MERVTLGPDYTRSDRRAPLPAGSGPPDLALNRLARFWRPIIDLAPAPEAPVRLRTIPVVSGLLAAPGPAAWPWFSMIGVPGLRHQVLRHAGLDEHDCREPSALPEERRSPAWRTLVAAVERFPELELPRKALLVFHLAQLSYPHTALTLAGDLRPTGEPEHDRYLYEVARVRARMPGGAGVALEVYRAMAAAPRTEPLLALAACFQGIGQSVRGASAEGRAFERRGREVLRGLAGGSRPDDWHVRLVEGRFHRAVAVLRRSEGDPAGMREALRRAWACQQPLDAEAAGAVDALVALESRRSLLETQLHAAVLGRDGGAVRHWCRELLRLDPTCVEARSAAGDGYAAVGDLGEAAHWYEQAGGLGTGAGATAWYRAARCHEALGDRAAAAHAMALCLELDNAAVEPRRWLRSLPGRQMSPARMA